MNFQLDKTASKSNVILPIGSVNKPFDVGASYFNMENQEEIWKDIVGYEGLYQVSNIGNIRSLDREVPFMKTKTFKRGNIKKQQAHTADIRYRQLALSKNGKVNTFLVHRLVALAFLPKIENKDFVNHIDGNPSNNNVENLEWCTRSENLQHSYDKLARNGRRTPTLKLSLDGFIIDVYPSQTMAAKLNNAQTSEITRCCSFYKGVRNGRNKGYVKGYIYM